MKETKESSRIRALGQKNLVKLHQSFKTIENKMLLSAELLMCWWGIWIWDFGGLKSASKQTEKEKAPQKCGSHVSVGARVSLFLTWVTSLMLLANVTAAKFAPVIKPNKQPIMWWRCNWGKTERNAQKIRCSTSDEMATGPPAQWYPFVKAVAINGP